MIDQNEKNRKNPCGSICKMKFNDSKTKMFEEIKMIDQELSLKKKKL